LVAVALASETPPPLTVLLLSPALPLKSPKSKPVKKSSAAFFYSSYYLFIIASSS
jgi:hypothetical protein